jgi:uncharacterized repeat protein (TIGR02543 family)
MAKYAYDVNKQTKILDVQKQFPGGLKTVDTDDALGKVYLKKANNVSLSEYSFLEKRHGTYVQQKVVFDEPPTFVSNPPFIQGYFEYVKENGEIDKILFVDGASYIKQSNEANYKEVETFISDPGQGFTYPEQETLSDIFNVEAYQFIRGDMLPPDIDTVFRTDEILLASVINRDVEPAEVFYSINEGNYVSAGVLDYLQEFEIPNIPVPTEQSPTKIEAYAEDPNEVREDSAVVSEEYFVNLYTITFVSNGGTSVAPQTYLSGASTSNITSPTRDEYFFGGWYSDVTLTTVFTPGTPMPENDLTLYARWTQVNLRMRAVGRYTDNLQVDLAIPGDAITSEVDIPPINLDAQRLLTNSVLTISSNIPIGSSGGSFEVPASVVRQLTTGSNVTWSFLRWEITFQTGNSYTFNNRVLPNPFDPSSVGLFIELYTAPVVTLVAVYTAVRPTYTIQLTTNKTSGTRNAIYQAPIDFGNNTYEVYSVNPTLTITEGTIQESSYLIQAPLPDADWNWDGFYYTTDYQGNAANIRVPNTLEFGQGVRYMISDQFTENDQRNIEARFSLPEANAHPLVNVGFSHNVNTDELTVTITNSNMTQTVQSTNVSGQLLRRVIVGGNDFPDAVNYSFNNGSIFDSIAGGESTQLVVSNVSPGEKVWFITETYEQDALGPILRPVRTQVFIYTVPQIT